MPSPSSPRRGSRRTHIEARGGRRSKSPPAFFVDEKDPERRLLPRPTTIALLLSSPTLAASNANAEPCAAPLNASDASSDGAGEVALCPVRCFRPDPVYGADGVTYWCGCPEAACADATVARCGYCEVGAGSAPVSGRALLLVHIVWLFVLGAAVLLGFL